MNNSKVKRNIILYYIYEAMSEPLFWGPILILYIQSVSKMSLSEIYIMEAVVVGLLIILEVPTGAIADLIGRKKTIFIGGILAFADLLLFSMASSPLMIWIANIVWVFGFSLASGADTSFVYDSLKEAGQEHKFKKVIGRAWSYRLFLVAFASIAVGYLAKANIRLPLWLSLPFLAASVLTSYFFVEPKRVSEKVSIKAHWNLMKVSVLFVANHKKIKWIVAYVVLIGVVSKIWFFTYNPYFELVNLPVEYYGWLFFGMNIIAAGFSFFAYKIAKRFSEKFSLYAMIALTALPIIAMSVFVAMPAVLLILFQNMVRGYIGPFTNHFLHDNLDSKNRATVISIKSAAKGLGELVFLGIFGLLLNYVSLQQGLLILGIGCLFVGAYLLTRHNKVFKVS